MSKTAEEEQQIKDQISGYVLSELGGTEKVIGVEENCGSMWITTKDGKTYSVSIMESELEDDDEEA